MVIAITVEEIRFFVFNRIHPTVEVMARIIPKLMKFPQIDIPQSKLTVSLRGNTINPIRKYISRGFFP